MDTHRPFTTRAALAAGLSRDTLAGPRFQRLFRGVHIAAEVTLDLLTWIAAARLLLPADAAASHTTAMRLHGYDPAGQHGLEFSTNTQRRLRVPGITLHRRRGTLHPRMVGGTIALGPDRTFVDVATKIALPELVAFGDHLIHRGFTNVIVLSGYAHERHLDGVRRARRVAPLLRAGAESPRESLVRLMIRFARLPEPEVNGTVLDAHGAFLARCDLVFRRWKIVVEYDGIHHRDDAAQWQRDLRRRELLEAAGWTVIVVTAADLRVPASVPSRVHAALVAHGYRGPAPVLSTQWTRWFTRI